MAARFAELQKMSCLAYLKKKTQKAQKNLKKQLLNPVLAKYGDLSGAPADLFIRSVSFLFLIMSFIVLTTKSILWK